jgi:hypothetical protein
MCGHKNFWNREITQGPTAYAQDEGKEGKFGLGYGWNEGVPWGHQSAI